MLCLGQYWVGFRLHIRSSLTCNMLSTMNYLMLVDGDHARLSTLDFVSTPMGCRWIEGGLLQACGQMIKYHHQERASVSRYCKVHNHYLFVTWFGSHSCKGALWSLTHPVHDVLWLPACWNAVLQANVPWCRKNWIIASPLLLQLPMPWEPIQRFI